MPHIRRRTGVRRQTYNLVTQAEPRNGRAWYRNGVSLYSLGDYPGALAALKQAVDISGQPVAMFALGRAYAALKKPGDALVWLDRAADAGYNDPQNLQNGVEFAAVRSDARFAEVLATVTRNAAPCSAPEYHQFDFWVGEWNVFAAGSDTQVGSSSVQSILGGWRGFRELDRRGRRAGQELQ